MEKVEVHHPGVGYPASGQVGRAVEQVLALEGGWTHGRPRENREGTDGQPAPAVYHAINFGSDAGHVLHRVSGVATS